MTQHVLVVSLGPVQDFIAAARRCQDLWFGSWLLSDLARAAATGIEAAAGEGCLVFPASLRNVVPVANKIVAVIADHQDAATVAESGRESMRGYLEVLATKAFKKLPEDGWDKPLAELQIQDVIEYVWAAAPFAPGYAAAREQAERLLAARKNTKRWEAVPWGPIPARPKSSIDGQRESVLHESLYDDVKEGRLSVEELRRRYFVKKSERLCGVGLLKRVGEQVGGGEGGAPTPKFHSNSHVTAGPLLVRLKGAGEAGARAFEAYVAELRRLDVALGPFVIGPGERTFGEQGLDGYLLFEDRLPEVLEAYAPSYAAKSRQQRDDLVRGARGALRSFLDAIGHRGPPTAYYALLLADGDQMGDAIRSLPKMDDHQALSRALADFAGRCRGIVEGHDGSFVYSGGDDVLALLPLHTALACADELRQSFGDTVRAGCPALVSVPTLSVGLGIAHHLEAVDDVRALAKRAEKGAKRKRGSLGIAVSKRSGATLEITGRWDETPALHERLEHWCRLFVAEDLPDGVAFELEETVAPFLLHDAADAAALKEVVLAVARRVLGRKRRERGKEPLDAATVKALAARFEGSADPVVAVQALSRELQVARVFLAAYESAGAVVNR